MTTTGSVGSMRLDARKQVQPFFARSRVAGVVQIDERDVELACLDRREDAGRRRGRLQLKPLAFQQQPQRLEHVRLIVGDENARVG